MLEQGQDHPSIWSRSWSPDSRRLAIDFLAATEPPLIVDAATGRRNAAPQGARLMTVWSPDGKTLASSSGHMAIGLWDAATNRLLRTLESKAGMFAWSPNGKMLAGFEASRMGVWSMETGKELWRLDEKKRRFDFAWSPDSRQLATTTLDGEKGTLWLWEAETGKLLHEYPCPASGLSWSPDGKTLAADPVGRGECVLIDAATGKVRLKAKGVFTGMQCIHWAPDGKMFRTLDGQNMLRAWDSADGRQLWSRHVGGPNRDGCWSPDGRVLARSSPCQISLYDAAGQPLGVLLPFDAFGQLAITADGRYRGNARVERLIRMVVQKRDGATETLTPREFEQKYNFKNDPAKVQLTDQ